jgi:hypothetical protein
VGQLMGARAELAATGRPGPATASLLYRTVRAVALSRNFPPPPGSTAWDASAVEETAHDLIDGKRGAKRLTDALLRSTDEASFARILDGTAVNYLRDLARATDFGKLVLRVTEVLRKEGFPVHDGQPPRWGHPDGPARSSTASTGELAAAAMAEPHVVVPRWTSDRRDPPFADAASLVRILRRILTAADGSITSVEAAHAVAARIEVRRSPLTVEVGVLERVAEAHPESDPAEEVVARAEAARLFRLLDDRERIALACFHQPLQQAALALTLGRSQAALVRQRLVRRLQHELGLDLETGIVLEGGVGEDAADIVVRLRDLCTAWAEEGAQGLERAGQ